MRPCSAAPKSPLSRVRRGVRVPVRDDRKDSNDRVFEDSARPGIPVQLFQLTLQDVRRSPSQRSSPPHLLISTLPTLESCVLIRLHCVGARIGVASGQLGGRTEAFT